MIGRMILFETTSVFSSKKFLFAFLFQFILIITLIPLLDTYMESLEKNEFVSLTPGTRNFVPAASSNSELAPYLKSEKTFRLYEVGEREGKELLGKRIVSTYLTKNEILLDPKNPKSEVAKFYLSRILQKISLTNVDMQIITSQKKVENPQEIAKQEARTEIKKTAELVRTNKINVTTILILLLPLFVSSGLLLDSLMGEKEKRTQEILLALPTSPQRILASKITSIFSIVIVQVGAYLILLFFMNRVSTFLVALPLILTSLLLISITTFVAVYSKNYKEAGFIITVLYVLLFSFMFGATTVYTLARKFSYLSPLTLIVIIESGRFSFREVLWSTVPTLLASSFLFLISSIMYGKDDFQFGPRPSNASLLASFVSDIGRSPVVSSIVGGFLAVPLSLLFELSAGIILAYLLGTGKIAVVGLILLFAVIEEAAKSLGVLSAKKAGGVHLPFYGIISGATFALSESLLFIFSIQSVFPAYLLRILILRLFSATLLHIACSGVVAWGIRENKYYSYLGVASLLHAAYNLFLVMG